MGPIFSSLVLIVTIVAAFMIGIAVSRRLVSGILRLMMVGRLKHKQAAATPAPAVALNVIQGQ